MYAYRKLKPAEIYALESQLCSCDDWDNVVVGEGFSASGIQNCRFEGKVCIGAGVRIRNVGSVIANYRIDDRVTIENVARIECDSFGSFGNGTAVAAVNENGGRRVLIHDNLTAQQAYISAFYRHRPKTIARLERFANDYASRISGTMGHIGCGVKITDCGVIRNMRIGSGTVIEGAALLQNGSIMPAEGDSCHIGTGVSARDFIIKGASCVTGGALLERCFVGEGVRISALTATDTLFFADCDCSNGEMCSVFAGPYTVTHHKSTLLIAGAFSFFNAGSGSNQSNHLFKTGAVHQAVHMRGCKFASGAYVMSPAVNGPYTVVLGSHKSHADTQWFPFSYLIEENDGPYLLPGFGLGSYGTVRDISKWPARDKRNAGRADFINFEECNPYIAERMAGAIERIEALLAKSESDVLGYERIKIRRSMLMRGLTLYRLALDKYTGTMLAKRANICMPESHSGEESDARGGWIDAAGMYVPLKIMERILDDIDGGAIANYESLSERLRTANSRYALYAYSWALGMTAKTLGREPSEADIDEAVRRGEEAAAVLRKMTDDDRRKDFSAVMAISYGIDRFNEDAAGLDFDAVRGKM